jgi:hypothetical protein
VSSAGTDLSRLYWGLALVGAIFPYVILLPWLAQHGLAPGPFVRQLFATGPATIFASDVLYASAVFVLFVVAEGRRLGMKRLWLPPLLIAVFGLCCALPAFLAMRERARQMEQRDG